MVGWDNRLDGHEFEQAPGAGDGQGSLACLAVHGVTKSQTQLSKCTDQWFWEWFHGEVTSTTDSLSNFGETSKPLRLTFLICVMEMVILARWL